MRNILENSFYQLIAIYTVFIAMIAFGFLNRYSLQFHILGIALGVMGIFALANSDNGNKEMKRRHAFVLIGIALAFIIVFRAIPYVDNSIPIGYDAGLYKYGIEYGLKNLDNWILSGGMEPGFLYLVMPIRQ